MACLALSAIVFVAWTIAGALAYQRQGALGLQTTAAAAASCWLSATLALLLAGSLRNTRHAISGLLGGALLRFAIPLAMAAACTSLAPSLIKAGLLGYLALFFLLTLSAETLLLVWLLRFGLKSSGTTFSSRTA